MRDTTRPIPRSHHHSRLARLARLAGRRGGAGSKVTSSSSSRSSSPFSSILFQGSSKSKPINAKTTANETFQAQHELEHSLRLMDRREVVVHRYQKKNPLLSIKSSGSSHGGNLISRWLSTSQENKNIDTQKAGPLSLPLSFFLLLSTTNMHQYMYVDRC